MLLTGKATLRVPKSTEFVAPEDDAEEPMSGAGQEAAMPAESSKGKGGGKGKGKDVGKLKDGN